jgi:hypothetical protein
MLSRPHLLRRGLFPAFALTLYRNFVQDSSPEFQVS